MLFRWPRRAELYFTRKGTHGICRGRRFSLPAAGSSLQQVEQAFAAVRSAAPTAIWVWFSGALVEFGVIPPLQGRPTRQDLIVLARQQLRDQGIPDDMDVAVASPDEAGCRAWAAVPRDWKQHLTNEALKAKLDLQSMAPIATALARDKNSSSTGPTLALEEDGITTIPATAAIGRPFEVSTYETDAELAMLLDRIALRASGDEQPKFVELYAFAASSLLANRGWEMDTTLKLSANWRVWKGLDSDDSQ